MSRLVLLNDRLNLFSQIAPERKSVPPQTKKFTCRSVLQQMCDIVRSDLAQTLMFRMIGCVVSREIQVSSVDFFRQNSVEFFGVFIACLWTAGLFFHQGETQNKVPNFIQTNDIFRTALRFRFEFKLQCVLSNKTESAAVVGMFFIIFREFYFRGYTREAKQRHAIYCYLIKLFRQGIDHSIAHTLTKPSQLLKKIYLPDVKTCAPRVLRGGGERGLRDFPQCLKVKN